MTSSTVARIPFIISCNVSFDTVEDISIVAASNINGIDTTIVTCFVTLECIGLCYFIG